MLLKQGLNLFQFLIMCQLSHYLRAISTLTKKVLIAPSHSSFLFQVGCCCGLTRQTMTVVIWIYINILKLGAF